MNSATFKAFVNNKWEDMSGYFGSWASQNKGIPVINKNNILANLGEGTPENIGNAFLLIIKAAHKEGILLGDLFFLSSNLNRIDPLDAYVGFKIKPKIKDGNNNE